MRNGRIVIKSMLGKEIEFKNTGKLIDYAREIVETRKGVLSDLEQRVIAAARAAERGGEDFEAYARLPVPPGPPPEPTPLDDETRQAEAERDVAIAKRQELQEEMFRTRNLYLEAEYIRGSDDRKVGRLEAEADEARKRWLAACEEEGRARVRATALASACDRWRATQAYMRDLAEAKR